MFAPSVPASLACVAIVSDLILYPVKGCAGAPMSRAQVLPTGVLHDRTFIFVRASEGVFRSQRSIPKLSVIRPELTAEADKLTLTAPDYPAVTVDVRTEGRRLSVEIHGIWRGEAVDQGDEAAEWASTLVGDAVRLVRVAPDHARAVDVWHGDVTFTDSTPYT